jgi:hypothetical protein
MKLSVVAAFAAASMLTVGLAGATQPLPSASTKYQMGQNSTGLCNSMNPANEANLRKFPLGMRNLGPLVNPVACSIPGDQKLTGNIIISVQLLNEAATEQTINCILVDGDLVYGSVSYPKSITLAPGQAAPNTWDATAFGLTHFFKRSNINCTLPPQVVLSLVSWSN